MKGTNFPPRHSRVDLFPLDVFRESKELNLGTFLMEKWKRRRNEKSRDNIKEIQPTHKTLIAVWEAYSWNFFT